MIVKRKILISNRTESYIQKSSKLEEWKAVPIGFKSDYGNNFWIEKQWNFLKLDKSRLAKLTLTTDIWGHFTHSVYVLHAYKQTYRKLESTVIRAWEILLHRAGSTLFSHFAESPFSPTFPRVCCSIGVGKCVGRGRSVSTGEENQVLQS